MKNIGEQFIGNMLAIAGSDNELEVMFHRASNRDLIAHASDEELKGFAGKLCIAREQTEEECLDDLKKWRERIKLQLLKQPKIKSAQ